MHTQTGPYWDMYVQLSPPGVDISLVSFDPAAMTDRFWDWELGTVHKVCLWNCLLVGRETCEPYDIQSSGSKLHSI